MELPTSAALSIVRLVPRNFITIKGGKKIA
jgi:hypothetical protein